MGKSMWTSLRIKSDVNIVLKAALRFLGVPSPPDYSESMKLSTTLCSL